jgi:hypothetical protein
MKESDIANLHTRNRNQDPLENRPGTIRSCCGFVNNWAMGQFIDAQKTSIINGLAYRGLCRTNSEEDGATLLDNQQSLLSALDSA